MHRFHSDALARAEDKCDLPSPWLPQKSPGTRAGQVAQKDRLMSENLSDTENDERPENDAHNEHEEDRLTS